MDLAKILTYGVGSWLHFETACDRSGLFNEKYLTAPVGQILSARSGNRTLAEWKHPTLAQEKAGPGRRPEVDFYVPATVEMPALAVETKWAGRTLPSTRDILWDLIRLEMIAHHQNARCFLLLAGTRERLDVIFERKDFSDSGAKPVKKPMMRVDKNVVHSTPLVPTVSSRIPLLARIFATMQDQEFPEKIVTRRTAPFPEDPKKKHYQVFVWEVSAAGNMRTFRPRNSRHYPEKKIDD